MKKTTMTIFLICMLSLPFVSSSFAGKGGKGNGNGGGSQGQPGPGATIAALPLEDLNDDEVYYLTRMREEEKLARDVYMTLYEKWALGIFANIAVSEQRHMDAVGALIDKYDELYDELEDPMVDNTIGVFNDPLDLGLTDLYNELVDLGEDSEEGALLVGAFIEELEISHLSEALALEVVDNADIHMVFGNLLQGSAKHYSAFTRLLEGFGWEDENAYQPEFFDVDDLEAILSTLPEKGPNSMSRRGSQGRGSAQGPGNGSGPGDGECPFDN